MTIEEYNKNNGLKSGYTTGTCAAAAAKAAVFLLFHRSKADCAAVRVRLPMGVTLCIPIEDVQMEPSAVSVLVQKYSGDDPDITNGMLIGAKVELMKPSDGVKVEGDTKPSEDERKGEVGEVQIDGGIGIGKVTKPGLRLPVGEYAINPIPRKMIQDEVKTMMREVGITSDIRVTIFAPQGEEIAKRTFNPKLGIVGGISILGTTGLVMPMSSKALIETIEVEMKFQKKRNRCIIAAPGAYGSSFLKSQYHILRENLVEFSNYPGEMLDIAVKLDVEELVICGHIGKMVKLAGGIMNTHSNEADARLELMVFHLLKIARHLLMDEEMSDFRGYSKSDFFDLAGQIANCLTTSEAVELLKTANLLDLVMASLADAMLQYIHQRLEKAMAFQKKTTSPKVEVLVYTLEDGLLARTGERLLEGKSSVSKSWES